MTKMLIPLVVASLGIALALTPDPAPARSASASSGIAVSPETCTSAFLLQWRGYFRTPESDGRPGYKFYALGVDALCRHDYANAIHLFKVAGSWGYKPAEYTLAVMYFRGAGVPADRPLGAAWMELAAASGIPQYVRAQGVMTKVLEPVEVALMEQLHDQLEPTYGAAALRRASWQWKLAGIAETGSHLGHPMAPLISDISPLLSEYYRVIQENNDPYPGLDGFLTGRTTVGPLKQIGTKGNAAGAKPGHKSRSDGQQDQD